MALQTKQKSFKKSLMLIFGVVGNCLVSPKKGL